jgi:hypothetical protein
MHVDVVNSVVINRPVADVSQYAADPDNAPQWYENIKSVEWKTARPAQVGSRIDFVALSATPVGVYLRSGRVRPWETSDHANAGAAIPHGDDINVGKRERRHADGASEPGHAEWILSLARASDVTHGRPGQQEGSGAPQASS